MIRVRVRLFAMLRERAGRSSVDVELADGATAGDVWASLGIGEEPPALGVAVNRAYADRSTALADGDEVAFIPPVSGGAIEPSVALTDDADRPGRGRGRCVARSGAGAIATFSGTVRDHSRDRDVERLEYEIYAEMALAELSRIAREVAARHDLLGIAIVHRGGALRDRRDDRRDRLLGAAPRPGARGLPRDDRRAEAVGADLEARGLPRRRRLDRAGLVSDLLVLVPEHGEPVALSRAAWEATVDFLAGHQAFHESLLEAWRRAPGVVVSDLQATRMAGLADHEADDPDTDRGATATACRGWPTFCRDSGGFLVAGPEAMPAPAPPPGPVARSRATLCGRPDRCRPSRREPPAWHARARRVLGPFAVVLIFAVKWIAKLKILLVALPKIGFLKVALLGATNLWFYALFWGWQIAALGDRAAAGPRARPRDRVQVVRARRGAHRVRAVPRRLRDVEGGARERLGERLVRARRPVRSAASAVRCCGGTATRPAPT